MTSCQLSIEGVTQKKMTQKNICQFNKFGFCKFGNTCFRNHENIKCENGECSVIDCDLRHPRKCKFFMEYRNCKFRDYCKFSHEILDDRIKSDEINELRNKLEEMKENIIKKDQEIKQKDKEIDELMKNLQDRLSFVEKKNDVLEKKVKEIENEKGNLESLIISSKMSQNDENQKEVNPNVVGAYREEFEKESVKEPEVDEVLNNHCNKCDFIGKTEAGLKIHETTKHKGILRGYTRVLK